MKQLCLIVLALIIFPILGSAQFIGDSVIVYVDNRVEINVAISDYQNLKSSDDVVKSLEKFRSLLPELGRELSSREPVLVKITKDGVLTIEPGDPQIIFLEKDGKMSNTGARDRAVIAGEDYQITITTTDLSQISDLELDSCFGKVVKMLPKKTNWSRNLSYECINGQTSLIENKNNRTDLLELHAGAGAGLIKGNWTTDVSLGIGLFFNKKGMMRGPQVSANMIFDFASEGNMNINTFLNLGYAWDLERKTDKANILGVELGYLISRQGDLFGENTFKFAVTWSPSKLVTVSPQLFVTDNFNQAFPGVRIGFGF
jgi:hypothetical protein